MGPGVSPIAKKTVKDSTEIVPYYQTILQILVRLVKEHVVGRWHHLNLDWLKSLRPFHQVWVVYLNGLFLKLDK